MALDPSIAMQSKTTGLAPNLATGLKLGYDMSQMPRMGRQAQLKEQQGVRGDKQSQLMEIYAAYGKDSVDPAGFQDFQIKMQEAGFPVDGMTLENANRALQMGKNLTAAKSQASANANRVVNTAELGGGAMQITYADGRTEVVTPTEEQRKAIQAAQQAQIDYQKQLQSGKAAGTQEGTIRTQSELANEKAATEALIAAEKAKAEGDIQKQVTADIKFQDALGQQGGKVYANAQSAAQNASLVLPELLDLKEAVRFAETGKWSDFQNSLKEWTGYGDVADHQTLNARLMALAQDILNQQTGTKTDFDFKVAVEQTASMDNVPEANLRLIDLLVKRNRKAARFGDQVKAAYKDGGVKGVLDWRYDPASDEGGKDEELINKWLK